VAITPETMPSMFAASPHGQLPPTGPEANSAEGSSGTGGSGVAGAGH